MGDEGVATNSPGQPGGSSGGITPCLGEGGEGKAATPGEGGAHSAQV